ncbi:MAG: DUF3489 domain-containing protein [Pseudomonadota bacterium]
MTKPRLTDLQLVILSTAAGRDDLMVLPLAESLTTPAKVLDRSLHRLRDRDLVEEIAAHADSVTWRSESDGRRIGLRLSAAGREALGVEFDGPANDAPASTAAIDETGSEPSSLPIRHGTKKAALIEMLQGPQGITTHAIADALGWQVHTTRAALTGLRKAGFAIETMQRAGQPSAYRIAQPGASDGK